MDFDKKVVQLDINDILPNRFQPRIKFNEDSINELCESIREHGVIQPIVVRKMGDKFEIIAGERRFKASLLAGKSHIPAVITELNTVELVPFVYSTAKVYVAGLPSTFALGASNIHFPRTKLHSIFTVLLLYLDALIQIVYN